MRMRHALPTALTSAEGATQTATPRGNPVEHGNIRAIESGGQARYRAKGLRYHDLRAQFGSKPTPEPITRAGLPATMAPSATSLITTAPNPSTL